MKNIDVVKAFVGGYKAKSAHLKSEGDKLLSYDTVIAYRHNFKLYVDTRRYSNTTSKHQRLLKDELIGCNYETYYNDGHFYKYYWGQHSYGEVV